MLMIPLVTRDQASLVKPEMIDISLIEMDTSNLLSNREIISAKNNYISFQKNAWQMHSFFIYASTIAQRAPFFFYPT